MQTFHDYGSSLIYWCLDKSLLETQRKAHKEAVKQLLSFTNTQKQYEMLNLVTKRLVEVKAYKL